MKKLIFFSLFALIAFIWITSCSPNEAQAGEERTDNGEPLECDTNNTLDAYIGDGSSSDREYIDRFVFLGESTTYHLKSRGVLTDGKETKQVWAPKSGTLMLTPTVSECRIVYPDTGEELDLCDALVRKRPEYMLLTFGLNGAASNISRGEDYFKSIYSRLIDSIRAASPSTTVILQSCFPVARNMDVSSFEVDVQTLNRYIDVINEWTGELAAEKDVGFLNSSEIFKDEEGFLRDELQAGDGYHLNTEAYRKMIDFMRTHAQGVSQ